MSRGKDFRETRRRGFDDDNFSPRGEGGGFAMPRHFGGPPRPIPSGPIVDATVKWFNPEKGFGFILNSGWREETVANPPLGDTVNDVFGKRTSAI